MKTTNWTEATTVEAMADRLVLGVELEGRHLAIYRIEGAYYATDDICTHQHAFMSEGYVEDGCVECPLHQALFDIRTGAVVDGPADVPLKTYPVKRDGDRILVDLGE